MSKKPKRTLRQYLLPEPDRRDGKEIEIEGEIDFIIEENGILYPVEIKKNNLEEVYAASAFQVLDSYFAA